MTPLLVAQQDILPQWAQLGLAAIFVIAFITGQVVPGFIHKQAKSERDAERQRVEDLEQSIREKVIPALIASTQAIADTAKLVDELEVLVRGARDGSPPPPRPRRKPAT